MARSFKGMCNVCGIIGHKGADCFKLEEKKDKKDAFMKKQNENSTQYKKSNYNKSHRRENNNPPNYQTTRDMIN